MNKMYKAGEVFTSGNLYSAVNLDGSLILEIIVQDESMLLPKILRGVINERKEI